MRTLVRSLRPFLAALLLATGACGVLNFLVPQEEPKRPFSHRQHSKEQELECKACHAQYDKGDDAGMPASLKRCMMCHEGIDEQKPEDRKLAVLVGETPQWTQVTDVPEEVRFSHKTHTGAQVGCAECHVGIEASESITAEVRVSMDACVKCHAGRGKATECSVCHTQIDRDTPPATHQRNWKQAHGGVVRWGQAQAYGNRCELCHTEAACVRCHQDEAPANHTSFWRLKGHSVAVSVDRSACATCHRSDFCDRCHRETEPLSHTASWGDPQNRHCLNCHTPLANESCALCHKGTPSHALAVPPPAWHTPGMNCRQCHGLTAPLPHVDNGDACNGCHK